MVKIHKVLRTVLGYTEAVFLSGVRACPLQATFGHAENICSRHN